METRKTDKVLKYILVFMRSLLYSFYFLSYFTSSPNCLMKSWTP